LSGHRAVSRFGVASAFFLAWSTLARLEYSGKSFAGNGVVERLDDRIFKGLFWIGKFFWHSRIGSMRLPAVWVAAKNGYQ
jgi:hypothetical protein